MDVAGGSRVAQSLFLHHMHVEGVSSAAFLHHMHVEGVSSGAFYWGCAISMAARDGRKTFR